MAAIDHALGDAFSSYAVDPARVAVCGHSDGELFSHVIAFSPGFAAPPRQEGSPRLFLSHGTLDGWLPVGRCSRRIVPRLERAGYDVTYREFDGPHVVPPRIGREAAAWLVGRTRPSLRTV